MKLDIYTNKNGGVQEIYINGERVDNIVSFEIKAERMATTVRMEIVDPDITVNQNASEFDEVFFTKS